MPEEIPSTQPQPDKQGDFRENPQKNNPKAGDKKKAGGDCGC